MTDQPQPQPQPRPPLWRVMDSTWWEQVDTANLTCPPCNDQVARVIRAVADWLVPEESIVESGEGYFRQNEREYLRDILLDEARRAEAGEQ